MFHLLKNQQLDSGSCQHNTRGTLEREERQWVAIDWTQQINRRICLLATLISGWFNYFSVLDMIFTLYGGNWSLLIDSISLCPISKKLFVPHLNGEKREDMHHNQANEHCVSICTAVIFQCWVDKNWSKFSATGAKILHLYFSITATECTNVDKSYICSWMNNSGRK